MKNKFIFLFVLMTIAIAFTGIVCAEDLYTIEVTEAIHKTDNGSTWYLDLSIPQVSGMSDKKTEDDLNTYFLSWLDYIVAEYNDDIINLSGEYDPESMPHFGYEYKWNPVVDTDDYFVFKTYLFYAAGSSMTVNEYWTFDKHTGELVTLLDKADKVRLEEIRSMIFEAMKKENEVQETFWLYEDDFNIAFSSIEEFQHWYINEKGNLVITFDKYEIAPGAFGESRFEIDGDEARLIKDEGYSFELTTGNIIAINESNWYLNISVPVISGLADPDEENQLNQHFAEMANGIQKEFESAVATAEVSLEEGNGPHFGYEYSYDIITDTDDIFAFKTTAFFAAGSSMTANEFWTLDKKSGKLVKWEDVVPEGGMQMIHDQIFDEMTAANEAGEGLYYTDDESLGLALSNVPAYHHWYLNNNGNLVITFDKYEVAVGAQGTPEFVIKK